MVFVTVGTGLEPMMRLLMKVDELAGAGVLDDVFVQSGNNPAFRPRHCKCESLMPLERFEAMVATAELVICHAGAGTAIQVLRAGKQAVMMPRRKKHGEVVDDHQLELVRALAEEGRVVPVYEAEELEPAIAEARRRAAIPSVAEPARMIALVEAALLELGGRHAKKSS